MAQGKPDHGEDPQLSYSPPTKPNAVVRLIRWAWHAWLVYVGLLVLVVAGLFVKDGAWYVLPFFAFFAYVAYVQIRNRRGR